MCLPEVLEPYRTSITLQRFTMLSTVFATISNFNDCLRLKIWMLFEKKFFIMTSRDEEVMTRYKKRLKATTLPSLCQPCRSLKSNPKTC